LRLFFFPPQACCIVWFRRLMLGALGAVYPHKTAFCFSRGLLYFEFIDLLVQEVCIIICVFVFVKPSGVE
jgi:hypothetical protein